MMKRLFCAVLVLVLAAAARAEIYIALTNFPAQGPVVDAFRYKLADFKNNAFYFDADQEKIKLTAKAGTNDVEVTTLYSLWLQEEPADLVMIVPGLGDHYRNSTAAQVGEAFFDAGFSVAVVSNPFNWEFMRGPLSSLAPGYTRADAKDLYRQLCRVRDDIEDKYPAKVKGVSLVGYSLGALQLAFLQGNEQIEHRLGVKRYLLLSPPVNLVGGLLTLDRYYDIWRKWDEGTIVTNRNKAVSFYKGYSAAVLKRDSYLPVNDEEAAFVIGFMFRMTLQDCMKTIVQRHALEIFGEYSTWKQQEFEKQLERYSYRRYVDTFLRMAHSNAFVTSEPFKNVNSLCSLPAVGSALQNDKSIYMIHAADDFLETDYDRSWLKRTMGDRLVMLDHGSHLGYFCMPQALDLMVKIVKGEPVSGPKPATAKPQYNYFDSYLAQKKGGDKAAKTAAAPKAPEAPAAAATAATAAPAATPATADKPAATSGSLGEMTVVKTGSGASVGAKEPTLPAPVAPVKMREGRQVEMRLMPDPERGANVLTMQEVDVETGLSWADYKKQAGEKAEKSVEAEAAKAAEKAAEKEAVKATEKALDKTAEKAAEKEAVKATEKAVEKTEKAAEKEAVKATEKAVEKTEKAAEKEAVKATEKAVEKSAEKAEKPAVKKSGHVKRSPRVEGMELRKGQRPERKQYGLE